MGISVPAAAGMVGAAYGLTVGIIGGHAEATSANGIVEGPVRKPLMLAAGAAFGAFGIGTLGAMAGRGGAVTGALLVGGAASMVGIGIGSMVGAGIAHG